MITTLIPERLFDGKTIHYQRPISFGGGKVISFDTVKGAKEYKLDGLLCPGFIDVQVNGGGGYLFNHDTSLHALQAMVAAHARFGTTSLLPTIITSDIATINNAANTIALAMKEQVTGILGVHFEGPHISEPKKGIHSSEHIRPLTEQELNIYCRDDLGLKIVTLAPENVTVEQLKRLTEHDVKVCLGHSNASFEITRSALEAGATGFTHLFNAMSQLTSREPNMVGAALLDEHSWCGLILDGHHVHPATAKLANSIKNTGKMMLVTDSMSTIGSNQQELSFDGHKIKLSGDKLTSQTGQLAGSALNMITAVNNAQAILDIPLEEALRMASLYPANFLGLNKKSPQLTIGSRADFTLLSTTNLPNQVVKTWIDGKEIFTSL